MNLAEETEIHRICCLSSIESKEEFEKWLLELYKRLDILPDELNEAIWNSNKIIDDISHMLLEFTRNSIDNPDFIRISVLNIIADEFHENGDFQKVAYSLDGLMKFCPYLKEKDTSNFNYFSDGWFLAFSNTYGNIKDLEEKFQKYVENNYEYIE